jgi:hypothetical protein
VLSKRHRHPHLEISMFRSQHPQTVCFTYIIQPTAGVVNRIGHGLVAVPAVCLPCLANTGYRIVELFVIVFCASVGIGFYRRSRPLYLIPPIATETGSAMFAEPACGAILEWIVPHVQFV